MSEAIAEPVRIGTMLTKILVAYWCVLGPIIVPMNVHYDEMTFVFGSRKVEAQSFEGSKCARFVTAYA